jgi:hypothetical protein
VNILASAVVGGFQVCSADPRFVTLANELRIAYCPRYSENQDSDKPTHWFSSNALVCIRERPSAAERRKDGLNGLGLRDLRPATVRSLGKHGVELPALRESE